MKLPEIRSIVLTCERSTRDVVRGAQFYRMELYGFYILVKFDIFGDGAVLTVIFFLMNSTAPISPSPDFNFVGVGVIWFLIAIGVTGLVYYYAHKRTPWYVLVSVSIGWVFPFSIVFLLPVDLSSVSNSRRSCVFTNVVPRYPRSLDISSWTLHLFVYPHTHPFFLPAYPVYPPERRCTLSA